MVLGQFGTANWRACSSRCYVSTRLWFGELAQLFFPLLADRALCCWEESDKACSYSWIRLTSVVLAVPPKSKASRLKRPPPVIVSRSTPIM